jgi:hypothetical protein
VKSLRPWDPDEVWEPEAKKLGLSVAQLRDQVRLADEIILEIINEDILQLEAKIQIEQKKLDHIRKNMQYIRNQKRN